jgi:hypothetical protein
MNAPPVALRPNHQVAVDRFVTACRADARVLAAILGGSYAAGTADAYSDIDLGLITTDEAHDDFCADYQAFIRQLGEPVFLETFDSPNNAVFFIFADDTEGELLIGRASQFTQIHIEPHRVLLDKTGILTGAVFTGRDATDAEQLERVRRQITWFWHDLSHFITALARGQLWWAHGQLEDLRRYCLNLVRLRQDLAAEAAGCWKVDQAVPAAQLAPLQVTFCALEPEAMCEAALGIVRYYQELARGLAATHGIAYPAGVEQVMLARLARLGDTLRSR